MKENKEKILFVIPSASVNGALIVLMDFYDYLLEYYPNIEIETIAQWGKGEDEDTFFRNTLSKYGQITFMQELSESEQTQLKERVLNEEIDAIFYNSIISSETQMFFIEKKCKKIFFVHEMERLLNVFNLKRFANFYQHEDNMFIACSESVKLSLMNVLDLKEDRITVLYSFINPDKIRSKIKKAYEITPETNNILSTSEKQFTIGFSGTFEFRKSADLLLPLVVEIKKRINNPKIFWIGASPFIGEPTTFDLVMHDVKVGGFGNDIQFIPKSRDHIKYYQRFDVYVMISREDPFPLVNLEVGALGIPVICFEKSGGSPVYADYGCGVTVPFMDLSAIADKIFGFYSNPQLLANYKKTIPLIIENNFSVKVQAPKLLSLIRNFYIL